eukprot:7111535-Prymnesium_polylepis.1
MRIPRIAYLLFFLGASALLYTFTAQGRARAVMTDLRVAPSAGRAPATLSSADNLPSAPLRHEERSAALASGSVSNAAATPTTTSVAPGAVPAATAVPAVSAATGAVPAANA